MNDFKLKMILSILSGIVFSFIFIFLAFILPAQQEETKKVVKKPKGRLELISHGLQNK